jgi:hypothetical protein
MSLANRARGVGRACALAALVLLTGRCSHSSNESTASSSLAVRDLPCDVASVLDANCTKCHAQPPLFGAPMPLVTYDDLIATRNGSRTLDLVLQRVSSTTSPMPPPPNTLLTPAEIATLQMWSNAGASPSSTSCAAEAGVAPSSIPTTACTPDTHLRATSAFTLNAQTPLDDYVCYGVDIASTDPRQVIGIAPHIDDTRIVHHVLLMQSDDSYPSDPTPCNAGLAIDWRLVSAWAPGTGVLELPPEAGFPLGSGTTHWVVQVHYNNALGLTSATDQSGFDVCTTTTLREYDAGIVAFGGTDIDLPPLSKRTLDCRYALPQSFDGATFFNAMPHMHKLGVALSSIVTPSAGGADVTIVNQPSFSFQDQYLFPIDVTVHGGDVVDTKCTWNNSTDSEVTFGEGTGNEMCFDFAAYYPLVPDQTAVGAPIFNWATPSFGADCTLE